MSIKCDIVTPNGHYKTFDADILNILTIDGQRGIYPRHTPFVTMLQVGKMSYVFQNERYEYAIAGGIIYFEKNQAKILTDAIESKDEIDIERAKKAKERAEKRLKDEKMDYHRAELALQKALNRITIKGGK